MPEEMAALTLLGESADWLKDAEGVSIRDHRMGAVEAFQAAWSGPADNARQTAAQQAFTRLLIALRHNHLYPSALVLDVAGDKGARYLPAIGTARRDFEHLQGFCVVNKFGIGEAHLLYMSLLLCRMLHCPEKAPYDAVLEQSVGDVVYLRVPIFRADNLGAFSSELRARVHAIRIMRSMRKMGLMDETPVTDLTPQDMAEMRQMLLDPLRTAAGHYVQRPYRLAFSVLESATALEEHARAHAANRASIDDRLPEELFSRLRRRIKQLPERTDIGANCAARLLNLAIASSIRALAHVDASLGRDIYTFLRSEKYHPPVRHSRMFELLPNNAERLRFLNFLFVHGKQNPVYYIEKFGKYIPGEKLHFESKETGFTFEPQLGKEVPTA